MSDTNSLKDRAAIVTGGGRGIGRAVALEFASMGAVLHVVSQSDNACKVAEEIRALGGKAEAHVGNVADQAFCRDVVQAAEKEGAGPDVVVNAASILGPSGRFQDCDMAEFENVMAVNFTGSANFMRWALPGMEARKFGRIVNFAGGGAAYSYPMFSPYGTSKAALVRLTEIVADEVRSGDVTINIIAPGAVATDMLAEVRRRGGEVRTVVGIEEPVKLVRFLASPVSRHVNGRFIHARDSYEDPELFAGKDMLRLRRTEKR